MAFLPTTPRTGPFFPRKRRRWPTSTWGSQPPRGLKAQEALSLHVAHDDPDLVQVAQEEDLGPLAGVEAGVGVAVAVPLRLGEGARPFPGRPGPPPPQSRKAPVARRSLSKNARSGA
jgi:hypothetical protein